MKPLQPLQPVAVKKLLGIRNTVRPERQPWGACADAVNVVVDDTHTLERREGYVRAVHYDHATDAFSPHGDVALFVVVSGWLLSVDDELEVYELKSGLTDEEYQWAEVGDRVYYAGATEAGSVVNRFTWQPLRIPIPDVTVEPTVGSRPAGQYQVTATYTHDETSIEGPAAPVQTINLNDGQSIAAIIPEFEGYTANIYISECNGSVPYLNDVVPLAYEQRDAQPFPDDVTALAGGGALLYAAIYDPARDVGFVHWSQPFWATCWKLATDYVSVPGLVVGMAMTGPGLVILTTHSCWLWDGENLTHLADYPGIPGRCVARDHWGRFWFWTKRGVCTLDPENGWTNLTEERISVPPGSRCTTQVIERRGGSYFVVVTDRVGKAANAYATPPPAGTCWCVNLKNGETTRFKNFDFLAFVQLHGEYYGLKADGLFAIEGNTDATDDPESPSAIEAVFYLHPTDFGDSTVKRCTYAYVTGCDDVVLAVGVECDGKLVGEYEGRRRIPLARGAKGQFWGFGVADHGHGPMRMTGFEVLVEPTSRRV